MWILIIILQGSTTTVTTIDFMYKKQCEATQTALQALPKETLFQISTVCVAK
jgi:hypothetical protein